MANHISQKVKDRIVETFILEKSIRRTASIVNCSRNTVRKVVRNEGLSYFAQPVAAVVSEAEKSAGVSFAQLERLFQHSSGGSENMDFENDIKTMTKTLAEELKVVSQSDVLRLENAVLQFIIYRRFYLAALKTSDKRYEGPFSKSHEKQARATLNLYQAALKALDSFNQHLRELEISSGKKLKNLGPGYVLIHNTQLNLSSNRTVGFHHKQE